MLRGDSGANSTRSIFYPRILMDTFAGLLAALARADVDFIVVDGLAVAFAGYPRVTDDVDILINADSANIKRMLGVLSDFGDGARRNSPRTTSRSKRGASASPSISTSTSLHS
jgi:hypothetical protein